LPVHPAKTQTTIKAHVSFMADPFAPCA
jgi:hypothetical protein